MNSACLFCELSQQKHSIILENEYFYSRFDEFPVTPRHAEIVAKRHAVSLLELTQEEWNSLLSALKETKALVETVDAKQLYEKMLTQPVNDTAKTFVEKALASPFLNRKPDGYNFGNNDGEAAGRTIHHLHIHLIPRYLGDVINPKGGIRNIIPTMGDYH